MKILMTSAILLTTSAAYGMDLMELDDTAQKHTAILKDYFSTLKPIATIKSEGAIHAYLSLREKITHVFIVKHNKNSDVNSYKRFYLHKDQKVPALSKNRKMKLKDYDQYLSSFEQMHDAKLVTKLPLGDY